ncbi:hypothetical protein ACFX13_005097 [Malus domestica]
MSTEMTPFVVKVLLTKESCTGQAYWWRYGVGSVGVQRQQSSSACDGCEFFEKFFIELDEVKLPVHLDKFVCESRGMLCLVVFCRWDEDVHIWEMNVEDGCCFSIRHKVSLLPRMERETLHATTELQSLPSA